MKLNLIVAISSNGVIGYSGGELPWKLSTDLKRFKSITSGYPVVVGRKTFDTFKKFLPNGYLPGRDHIVLTRDASKHGMNITPTGEAIIYSDFSELDDHLLRLSNDGVQEAFIIGGGDIYRHMISNYDIETMYVTKVITDVFGDTVSVNLDFTGYDEAAWEFVNSDEHNEFNSIFSVYEKDHDSEKMVIY